MPETVLDEFLLQIECLRVFTRPRPEGDIDTCYSEPALLPSRPQRAGPVYTTQQLTVVEKIAPDKTTTRAVDLVRFVPFTRVFKRLSAGNAAENIRRIVRMSNRFAIEPDR